MLNRQSRAFGKDKSIKRFIEVFRAMFPLVVFELGLGVFIFLLAVESGEWRASALPLGILAIVAALMDCCYMVFNWDNSMI